MIINQNFTFYSSLFFSIVFRLITHISQIYAIHSYTFKKKTFTIKIFQRYTFIIIIFFYLKQNKIKQDLKKERKKNTNNKRKKMSTSKNRSSISKLWLNWNFSLFCQMSLIKQTGSFFSSRKSLETKTSTGQLQ